MSWLHFPIKAHSPNDYHFVGPRFAAFFSRLIIIIKFFFFSWLWHRVCYYSHEITAIPANVIYLTCSEISIKKFGFLWEIFLELDTFVDGMQTENGLLWKSNL